MVFTLHRYIFKELFKVFFSASLAMTVILSFASLLRPIQENGIGPNQAIHLLGYFIPITLTFVLPMGALFATALVYGRFASDNELDACRASGISITTMIYPALCLAVMVAISTLVLSFHVVPAFVHRAERTIRDNAKQILFRNIQRKGSFSMPEGGYRIYADKVVPEQDILEGVVITKEEAGVITKLMTAKAAKIEIDKDKDSELNRVRVTADEFYMLDDTGQAYASKLPIEDEFPSGLRDDVKFKKMEEIKKIKADMTYYPPVRKLILQARAQLAVEMLMEDVGGTISNKNIDDRYYTLENADRKIMFTAGGCELSGVRNIQLLPPIDLIEIDALKGRLLYKWESNEKANIKLEETDPFGFTVILENASWKSAAGYEGLAPAPKRVYRNMSFPATLTQKISTQDVTAQIQDIDTERSVLGNASSILRKQKSQIARKIWVTGKEITSEIHSRLVFGLGCVVLILTSSALGIMLKGGHLLTAFGASALPAGGLIVFIMSGKQLAKGTDEGIPDSVGVIVMWTGLVVLSLLTAWIYRKLMRA